METNKLASPDEEVSQIENRVYEEEMDELESMKDVQPKVTINSERQSVRNSIKRKKESMGMGKDTINHSIKDRCEENELIIGSLRVSDEQSRRMTIVKRGKNRVLSYNFKSHQRRETRRS
jgi:hypothetical protein